MCGIVGYVGNRPVQELLMQGLQRLEYRGYDSAGVSVLADGEIATVRAVGNLANLHAAVAERNASDAAAWPRRRSRVRPASPTPAGPPTAGSPSATRTR
jgi:glucosamine 6-phosphate synthetase-like amidotransferase/phosphosugar isomerase protein